MTYIVKRGRVEDGVKVYEVGDRLPKGIGDEAMVEAGSIELVGAKVAAALEAEGLEAKTNRELYAILAEHNAEVKPGLNKEQLIALVESYSEDEGGEE